MRKLTLIFVAIAFIFTCIMPPQGFAQTISALGLMPEPGVMVAVGDLWTPAHLQGMVIHPTDPFKFDFIIHRGDAPLSDVEKQQEYSKLIKYFLAALAVPDTDQWVNLSPYEQDRIIPDNFGLTEMGRDLLAQDYLLKQISSSLTNPETDLGEKFWNAVYEQAYLKFGSTDIPTDMFNKIWITPDKATVYEKGNAVLVLENHLKVMLESDYKAMQMNAVVENEDDEAVLISKQVMREIILPVIEKEVNEGKSFAPLRQVYSGMLLATWYKMALQESILGQLYANKGKVDGIDQDPATNQEIYNQYVVAFKKGVFNMIKEDFDQFTQEILPRKYFSGGTTGFKAYLLTIIKQLTARGRNTLEKLIHDLDRVSTHFISSQVREHYVPTREDLTALLADQSGRAEVSQGWGLQSHLKALLTGYGIPRHGDGSPMQGIAVTGGQLPVTPAGNIIETLSRTTPDGIRNTDLYRKITDSTFIETFLPNWLSADQRAQFQPLLESLAVQGSQLFHPSLTGYDQPVWHIQSVAIKKHIAFVADKLNVLLGIDVQIATEALQSYFYENRNIATLIEKLNLKDEFLKDYGRIFFKGKYIEQAGLFESLKRELFRIVKRSDSHRVWSFDGLSDMEVRAYWLAVEAEKIVSQLANILSGGQGEGLMNKIKSYTQKDLKDIVQEGGDSPEATLAIFLISASKLTLVVLELGLGHMAAYSSHGFSEMNSVNLWRQALGVMEMLNQVNRDNIEDAFEYLWEVFSWLGLAPNSHYDDRGDAVSGWDLKFFQKSFLGSLLKMTGDKALNSDGEETDQVALSSVPMGFIQKPTATEDTIRVDAPETIRNFPLREWMTTSEVIKEFVPHWLSAGQQALFADQLKNLAYKGAQLFHPSWVTDIDVRNPDIRSVAIEKHIAFVADQLNVLLGIDVQNATAALRDYFQNGDIGVLIKEFGLTEKFLEDYGRMFFKGVLIRGEWLFDGFNDTDVRVYLFSVAAGGTVLELANALTDGKGDALMNQIKGYSQEDLKNIVKEGGDSPEATLAIFLIYASKLTLVMLEFGVAFMASHSSHTQTVFNSVELWNHARALMEMLNQVDRDNIEDAIDQLGLVLTLVGVAPSLKYDDRGQAANLNAPVDSSKTDAAAKSHIHGGIDMSQSNLDMHIKRDGAGVPLPMSQQNLDQMQINGLVPIILDIQPVAGSPILSQLMADGVSAT